MTREEQEQMRVANDLQKFLGDKYEVRFDDCESCLTRVFYKAKNGQMIFVKEVPNEEMKRGISITEFELTRDQRDFLFVTNNL